MKCSFTFCKNEQGVGTWMQVTDEEEKSLPICENHWKAIRWAFYQESK